MKERYDQVSITYALDHVLDQQVYYLLLQIWLKNYRPNRLTVSFISFLCHRLSNQWGGEMARPLWS